MKCDRESHKNREITETLNTTLTEADVLTRRRDVLMLTEDEEGVGWGLVVGWGWETTFCEEHIT